MELLHFEFLPLEGQVDKKEGVIRDVSVITSGVEARGHKLHVDLTTLEQMKGCADELMQVPVKWNHKTGADAVNGYLTNFRIAGEKLKADWYLLKSHERYEQALELAEKMPKGVGLSASFRGKSEKVGGKMFARCSELPSVDLVASPAANPDGLFSEGPWGVDTWGKDMSDTNKNTPASAGGGEEKVVDFSKVVEAVNGLEERLGARLGKVEEFQSNLAEVIEEEESDFAASQQGGASHEFSDLEDPLAYIDAQLEARQEAEREFAEKQAREAELAELKEKLGKVVELNELLGSQNNAMSKALGELSDAPMEFSASGDGGVVLVRSEDSGLTDFEARVKELKSEGKEDHEAVSLAIKEDEDRYTDYLDSKGALG